MIRARRARWLVIGVFCAAPLRAQPQETPATPSSSPQNPAPTSAHEGRVERLHRASARLQRGDPTLASPLFESLFQERASLDAPAAALTAEGAARCRLALGDLPAAIEAVVELSLHRASDPGVLGDRLGPALLDAQTGLCPWAPPILLNDDLLARSALGQTPPTTPLEQWYDAAASAAREQPITLELPGSQAPDGERLLGAMVLAQSTDAAARAAARELLERELDQSVSTWREAWARAALGRSLLMEPESDDRASALVHLLHLPARFASDQPYLASFALALAAEALDRTGDPVGAARLRDHLDTHDPAARASIGAALNADLDARTAPESP